MLQFTQYTENIPNNFGGYTIGPWVRIRPKYKDDVGLHNHEYEHVRQFWVASFIGIFIMSTLTFGLFLTGNFQEYMYGFPVLGFALPAILYTFFDQYRFQAEIEAYAIQLNTYGTKLIPEWLITSIMTKYKLNVTKEQVISELAKRLS